MNWASLLMSMVGGGTNSESRTKQGVQSTLSDLNELMTSIGGPSQLSQQPDAFRSQQLSDDQKNSILSLFKKKKLTTGNEPIGTDMPQGPSNIQDYLSSGQSMYA